jgi:uncharacterized membrane protein YcfT
MVAMDGQAGAELRIGWVDAAKGLCIIFVVMMHSTLGVGVAMNAEGWMHDVVAFARPFRMPDFFLISGLFLGLVIDRPWLRYIDRKVVHFAYFYVLWLTIQFAFKAPGMAAEQGLVPTALDYLAAYVQPFGTLWFIYILPVFFVFTRLVKTLPVWVVFVWAAALEIMPIHTGWLIFDEFCARYVYFFVGYAFADAIFRMAGWARVRPAGALAYLAAWAAVNGVLVFTPAPEGLASFAEPMGSGALSELPFVSLVLGLAGALAIVFTASLVSARSWSGWLSWLGAHSIVIYLAFFLPMAIARVVLIRTGIVTDVGTISALVTAAGVIGPAVFYLIIRRIGIGRFLFERPAWAHIDGTSRPDKRLAAAE